MILLKDYQEKAVGRMSGRLIENLGSGAPERTIILDAPTGSGKTVMLASLLDRGCRDVVVLWATPGKGDLEEQSALALGQHLAGTPITVERLTDRYLSLNDVSDPGTVIVLNWEQITQRETADPATGLRYWKNLLAKGGENFPGLFAHLEATAATGTEVVIVIDESHYGRVALGGDTGVQAFLDAVDVAVGYPVLRIEASATPVLKERLDPEALSTGIQTLVRVPIEQVIAEGMLAREIRLNSGLQAALDKMDEQQAASITGERLVLEAAWAKTIDLARMYSEIGSPVRPLLIVQLPDNTQTDDRANRKRTVIKEFFAEPERNLTVENGGLMEWFSGEEKNEELAARVSDFSSPVQVLLFKHSISLGWDCPRAQVLLAFRDMASEIFRIQTIGRILRMPERRHYDDPNRDDLDCAFVFSNIGFTTHIERDPGTPAVAWELVRRFTPDPIPGSYASRAGTYNDLLPSDARNWLNSQPEAVLLVEELRNDPRVRALSSLDRVLTDQTVSITEVASGRVEDDENTHLEARTSETDLATAFDRQLKELVVEFPSKARSSAALKTVAYGWLEDIWAEQGDEAHADGVRALLLDPVLGEQSRAFLREAASACFAGLTRTPRQRKDYTFAFPERVFWPDKGCKVLAADNVCAKHLYTGPTGNATITTPTLSDPEQRFIEQIAGWVRDEKVEWWWKNGEAASVEGNTKFFSIAYTSTAGDASSTYPDFLVRFTSGLLAVLEAKDPELKDPESRAKAAALAAWQPKGVLAGVVYQRGTTWMLATTLDPIDDVELAPLLP